MLRNLEYRPVRRCLLSVLLGSTLFLTAADLGAADSSNRSWTETSGATPPPAVSPQPAVKSFNTKTTSIYTEKEAFLEASTCSTISLESFETLTATNQIGASTVSTDHVTITTDNPPRLGIWNARYQGAFATDGSQWMGIEENQLITPQVTTLSFDVLINHFSIYVTDYGDFGDGNLIFANDAGDEATAALSGEPSGNRQFFGIINSGAGFRTVTLTHEIAGEFFGVDEIYFCFSPGAPGTTSSRQSTDRVVPD